MILKEQNNQEKILTDRVLDVNHEPENMPSANGKRPSDSSLSHEEDLAKVIKLQEVIDRQSREQSQMKERLAALSAHMTELEADLDTARKDLLKSEEVNTKLQRDICEAGERHGSIEGRLCKMEAQLEEKNKELQQVQTLKEQDWEQVQQASVLASVAQAFESDEGMSDGEGDRITLFSSATQLSPSRQAHAKTPTVMLQEQLDAINEEIRLIKEEKENTEQQAEKTESMEGRRSLGNLRRFKSVSSLNRHPASLHAAPAHPAVGAPSPEGGTAWRRRETGWAS
ncbi:liprin-alpha-1-like [Bubalus bubalis]|uniref:liprin-alpha-1-like n=1 Tax=Bubalus bubalis TaxID=89462 RepID=UPI001E1B91DF|nr:liprin-alpha-1-like [Bubalus bubalis]